MGDQGVRGDLLLQQGSEKERASSRKPRDENPECHWCVVRIRVPVPFRGSANVERFPRIFQSALGRASV
jgi:hypothetical protein